MIISEFVNPTLMYAKDKEKYATTTVNIREKPNTKSKIIGNFYWNDKVHVIKKVNKDWYQIKYKNALRYVCSKYLTSQKNNYTTYDSPSQNSFKSYEDADCITNNTSISQGKLKNNYHLDYNSGVWMVGNRYCVALGSYYTKSVGIKFDLILSYKNKTHILKCIAADVKSDKDTVNKHQIHKDGSIAEFVVRTSSLPKKVRRTGDVSYAGRQFVGKIIKIKVYKEK